jgi:cell division protein FtsI (penicillin-binding protein 3)
VQVGAKLIKDRRNLGRISLATLLARSSNVGATKVAMSLPPEILYSVLSGFGLGRVSASGFPGESAGLLSHHSNWRPISQATLAYGYGVSLTSLQLVQAFGVIAADGLHRPVSLLRVDQQPITRRVIEPATARSVLSMLEVVVGPDGTGRRAAVAGYRVAGKTGTAKKFAPGGYSDDVYTALFAGVAPASQPRIAVAVIVDEPSGEIYSGGQVAAPIFSQIVAGSLRILAVAPDNLVRPERIDTTIAVARQ